MLRSAGGEVRYYSCLMDASKRCLSRLSVVPLPVTTGRSLQQRRMLLSSSARNNHEDDAKSDNDHHGKISVNQQQQQPPSSISHQRVWISPKSNNTGSHGQHQSNVLLPPSTWNERVVDQIQKERENSNSMGTSSNTASSKDPIQKIEEEEWAGGRMKARQLGVLHEDPVTGLSFTSISLY
jgi:hypothetical protein